MERIKDGIAEQMVDCTPRDVATDETDLKGQRWEVVAIGETDLKGQKSEVVATGETGLEAREENAGPERDRLLWWEGGTWRTCGCAGRKDEINVREKCVVHSSL